MADIGLLKGSCWLQQAQADAALGKISAFTEMNMASRNGGHALEMLIVFLLPLVCA